MFKDIVDGIKEDIKEDIDLYTGKDIRPYGEYNRFERNKLGLAASIKSLKMSWDKLGQEQEAAREAQMLSDTSKRTLIQKAKDFFARHKRGFVASFYVGMTCVAMGVTVAPAVNEIQNALPSGNEFNIVHERPSFNKEEQQDLGQMEQPVVTIDEQGNATITDKATEHEEFKAELQEGVIQEEELTQEQLEERAEINQEKSIEDSQVKESQEINIEDVVR